MRVLSVLLFSGLLAVSFAWKLPSIKLPSKTTVNDVIKDVNKHIQEDLASAKDATWDATQKIGEVWKKNPTNVDSNLAHTFDIAGEAIDGVIHKVVDHVKEDLQKFEDVEKENEKAAEQKPEEKPETPEQKQEEPVVPEQKQEEPAVPEQKPEEQPQVPEQTSETPVQQLSE